MNGAVERGDGPLVCYGAIEVPSLADVQEAGHFQRAGVSSAHACLDRERLVPVGHSDSQADGVEAVEAGVGISSGELLDGVVDAGHGLKEWWTSRPGETPLAFSTKRFALADETTIV